VAHHNINPCSFLMLSYYAFKKRYQKAQEANFVCSNHSSTDVVQPYRFLVYLFLHLTTRCSYTTLGVPPTKIYLWAFTSVRISLRTCHTYLVTNVCVPMFTLETHSSSSSSSS
jgi:hypothetical protein